MRDIREEVLSKGFSQEKQAFVQHYQTDALDATALLIPLLGFLPINDPRVISSVKGIQQELGQEGFVYRYLSEDCLEGREGTFLLCTFWLIDCLIDMQRLDEAEAILRKVEQAANHLGLFAEEYDLNWREALGNFPQAFTHIGYINSVLRLIQAREPEPGENRSRSVDFGLDFFRKKLLTQEQTLNSEAPGEHVPSHELVHRLKTSMNRLRGAFFDSSKGRVSYEKMKHSSLYQEYLDLSLNLSHFNLDELKTRAEKTSFWINIYNVIVIHGVIELGIRDSVKEVRRFFQRIRYRIGPHVFTPDDIEHGILRGNRKPPYALSRLFSRVDPRLQFSLPRLDPRIHFALVCASSSCPPIEVYPPENIDDQMTVSGRAFLNGGGIAIDRERKTIRLSRVFLWYENDFGNNKQERLRFIAPFLYAQEDRYFLQDHGQDCKLEYMQYDWHLNR